MENKQYISLEKKKELELELQDLKGPKRQTILEALQFARSLGDLSENAEYHQAREDQGKLEERISRIEGILQSSQVVTGGGGEIVEIGSKVVVVKKGDTLGNISKKSILSFGMFYSSAIMFLIPLILRS